MAGLFQMPTVVQNVETLSCIPHIVNNGAEWFKGLGDGPDPREHEWLAGGWPDDRG